MGKSKPTKFSLDDIKAAADAEYTSTEFEFGDGKVAVLTNPLRLSAKARSEMARMQERLDAAAKDPAIDQAGLLEGALLLACADRAVGKEFIAAIGGDLAVLAKVFESYVQGVQAGEA